MIIQIGFHNYGILKQLKFTEICDPFLRFSLCSWQSFTWTNPSVRITSLVLTMLNFPKMLSCGTLLAIFIAFAFPNVIFSESDSNYAEQMATYVKNLQANYSRYSDMAITGRNPKIQLNCKSSQNFQNLMESGKTNKTNVNLLCI